MFDYLKKLLTNESNLELLKTNDVVDRVDRNKQLQIATAALFIEMAKADGEFTEEERENVIQSLQKQFNIDAVYVNELMELSKLKLKDSVSLFEFSNVVNENFTNEDKNILLKNLWRLIYTDKKLDKYEDRLIKIIGGMMKMDHKQIINAKLLIRQELNLD
ncbi:MAG: TerB family tellurite resistance protein [Bacteroidetes bacterium]|nr:TerB family tellurite resistance protein [Bacteroidota bacterium]MCH7769626.1 TerB family tellurite resistance protein [Bacteroidota bacterium]